LLDTVLDRTLAGYTRLGPALRGRGWEPPPRMDGRTVLVTGATGGIGRAAAEAFAGLGARTLLLARDEGRGSRARDEIAAATGNDDVAVVLCDLARLADVRAAADRVLVDERRLDVLVNNAGVLPPERTLSEDGVELTFAVNVLAPFVLTEGLLPLLRASPPSRVITVSSGGMYAQRLGTDLQSERGEYRGTKAYARTKRAEVVLTELWAQRHAGTGVVFHSMHPGWVGTAGVADSLPTFNRVMGPLLRDAEQGADTIVWLGAAEEPLRSNGRFWHDRRERPTHLRRGTRETEAERLGLWDALARLARQNPTL
jgi:NAD(P)-dependent dehydrogenase (short-subunit alcohol dehydrogenase family)